MTGLENVDPKLRRQYEDSYGPFVAGDYPIGSSVAAAFTSGVVMWSYRQPLHGLTYVVDDSIGWPTEVKASQVRA